jgi:hypothetical protein
MAAPATAPPEPSSLKRIVAASLIGTTIEWYDNASFRPARCDGQHRTSTGTGRCWFGPGGIVGYDGGRLDAPEVLPTQLKARRRVR